jgi:hypothetical protein
VTNTTFGAWLLAQEQVDYGSALSLIAGVWRETKGDTKIRSLPGVQSALETAGKLADPRIRECWDEAVQAWRAQGVAPLQAVPDLPPGGIAELTGDSKADLDRAYERATGRPAPEYIPQSERIERKLDWLIAVLGAPAGTLLPPVPVFGDVPPVGWQEQFEAADHDAQQA